MKRIPLYKFFKHKYGAELLVDVVNLDKMKPDVHRTPVYRETFYSLLLIASGAEAVTINGHAATVSRGHVLTSIPGEIWAMSADTKLEALNLIFEEEFLLDFFSDTHFLNHFRYLQADRPSPFLILDDKLNDRLLQLYLDMQREIHRPEQDQHILRAMLYEALMLLNRTRFMEDSKKEIAGALKKILFLQKNQQADLSGRERKIIEAVWNGELPTVFSVKEVAALTGTSHDSALRDIQDLIQKEIVRPENKGGRSQKYSLI